MLLEDCSFPYLRGFEKRLSWQTCSVFCEQRHIINQGGGLLLQGQLSVQPRLLLITSCLWVGFIQKRVLRQRFEWVSVIPVGGEPRRHTQVGEQAGGAGRQKDPAFPLPSQLSSTRAAPRARASWHSGPFQSREYLQEPAVECLESL